MATKKQKIKRTFSLIALVLSLVSIAMFFVPSICAKDYDAKVSPYQICFVSIDKAKEEMIEKEDLGYGALITLKETEETKGRTNLAGWMSFATMLAGVVTIISLFLTTVLHKSAFKVALFSSFIMLLTSLTALISVGTLLSVKIGLVELSSVYRLGAGVVISAICSILSMGLLVTVRLMRGIR